MQAQPSAPNVLQQAQALLKAGHMAEAERLYRRVLAGQPGHPAALHGLAMLAQQAGDLAAAESLLGQAVAGSPSSAPLHSALGLVRQAQDKPAAAAESFRQAIALQRQDFANYGNLGNALQDSGDLEGAIAAYRKGLALRPGHPGLATNLAAALLKRGEAAEARQQLEGVLAQEPQNVRALAYLTTVLQELGADAEADRLLDLERLTWRGALPVPQGYANLEAFNAALADAIRAHPTLTWSADPKRRAVREGAVTGDILSQPTGTIADFKQSLCQAIDAYVAGLPDDAGHPFLGRKPRTYALLGWGNVLRAQGHQAPHVHNLGWLSGVYYVTVPDFGEGTQAGDEPEGAIEFGRPGYDLPIRFTPNNALIAPVAGQAIFFPSYFWHGTVPFARDVERISLAFDLRITS